MSERARHRRAKKIFFELHDLPRTAWHGELVERCGADDLLRREVRSLLDQDQRRGTPLDQPLLGGRLLPREPADLAGDALDPTTPGRIGNFEVLDKVGEGGMGVVYRALQDRPRREVALKVLRSALPSQETVARFHRECEILGRLSHPGIAPIYAAGTHDLGLGEQPYLAMELVRGEPLVDHIARTRPTTTERLHLFLEICAAVHYAHGQGVVHRDLKPANVLVDHSGQPRIIDFGIARLADDDRRPNHLGTQTGRVLGTLQFMSPEQVLGKRADERSDIYALGLLLWELLAGAPPYQLGGRSTDEVVATVCQQPPNSASLRTAGIDRDLTAIVLRALEKDPRDRYPSALDLSLDIRRHLEHEPVLARRSSWGALAKWVRRHPVRALAGGVLAAVAVLGIAIAAREARDQLRRADAVTSAWQAGDLTGARTQLAKLAPWSRTFVGPELAGQLDEVLALRARTPLVEVLRCEERDGANAARLLAARYLERDGLTRHPELARFLAHGLTQPTASAAFGHSLQLCARLFFERPDATPEETAASATIRQRLETRFGELDHLQHLDALTALAGCGTDQTAGALQAWLPSAALGVGLNDNQTAEQLRMCLLALASQLRRGPACGFGKAWAERGTDGILELAHRAIEGRLETPEDRMLGLTAQHLFLVEAFMRRMLGAPASAVRAPGSNAVLDACVQAARGDAAFAAQLRSDPSLPAAARRAATTAQALHSNTGYVLQASGILDERPALLGELLAAAPHPDTADPMARDYMQRGIDWARMQAAGQRGPYDPDEDTHLGAWFDLAESPMRAPTTVRDPLEGGVVASWIAEIPQVRTCGTDAELRWRNVVFVQDEHRREFSYARLGSGGISVIDFSFTIDTPPASDPLLRVSVGKALRFYLPHNGDAVIAIDLDGSRLSQHRVDSVTLEGIEIPVSLLRLGTGRHTLRVSLDASSTTTVRVRAVSLSCGQ